MARARITEFKSKRLIHGMLNQNYSGVSLSGAGTVLSGALGTGNYVVKVDQGIKQRMKRGLVALNVKPKLVESSVRKLAKKGYSRFIAEEMVAFEPSQERYLSLERTRDGLLVRVSTHGGIEVESHADEIAEYIFNETSSRTISKMLGVPENFLKALLDAFDTYYFSFLEINPLVVLNDRVHILDLAVEVDTAGLFLVNSAWTETDYVTGSVDEKTDEEIAIANLARKSQASLTFNLINKSGSIYVLLSGGGASIAVADAIYDLGYGERLANYGEYSGNPNDEETYLYTKYVLASLLQSRSKNKILIIAGGVANFTDVRKTFKGIMRAMKEMSSKLQNENVRVYVRRGGPHQEEGLSGMKTFLENENLLGRVAGPEMILTDIVTEALSSIK